MTGFFHKFDTDKSGYLEKAEAKKVADKMQELGFWGIEEGGFWGYIQLMQQAESDGDNRISLEEFLKFGKEAYENHQNQQKV